MRRACSPHSANRVLSGAVHVVAHCRLGFESECAEDLQRIALHAHSALRVEPGSKGFVAAAIDRFEHRRWSRALRERPPIFARSVFLAAPPLVFPGTDRITPIVAAARALAARFSTVWLETPDTNEGKSLSGLCRRLQPLLEQALRETDLLDATSVDAPRLHVLFTTRETAYEGISHPATGSAWPMGIPRLRMPHGAPSRSTLKLAEAFVTFLGDAASDLLRPGMRAVDLGAAPGGWSWQLAYRGLRVVAVDNGPLKGDVAQDPLVTHVREDGFAYRPRRPVDWMVCDMVEKPSRIAALVARWMVTGDARRCIFNLKLPMKRRYEEVMRCASIISDEITKADVRCMLRIRQLYHDREEVTGYLARSS